MFTWGLELKFWSPLCHMSEDHATANLIWDTVDGVPIIGTVSRATESAVLGIEGRGDEAVDALKHSGENAIFDAVGLATAGVGRVLLRGGKWGLRLLRGEQAVDKTGPTTSLLETLRPTKADVAIAGGFSVFNNLIYPHDDGQLHVGELINVHPSFLIQVPEQRATVGKEDQKQPQTNQDLDNRAIRRHHRKMRNAHVNEENARSVLPPPPIVQTSNDLQLLLVVTLIAAGVYIIVSDL